MDSAYEYTKYYICVPNIMQPESGFSSLINHNYWVFQYVLIIETYLIYEKGKINLVLTKLFCLIQLRDRLWVIHLVVGTVLVKPRATPWLRDIDGC